MPPLKLFDLDEIDLNEVEYDQAAIYARMPHRHEFQLLDGVIYRSKERAIALAYHDCREDEWWTRGHFPGRPIFPGVLQVEAAAQLVAFTSRYADGCEEFVAFGGVDECRFREAVFPPARLLILAKLIEDRPRRVRGDVQGVVNGRVVFEARIAGLAMPDFE